VWADDHLGDVGHGAHRHADSMARGEERKGGRAKPAAVRSQWPVSTRLRLSCPV
jgi:hypothetical protein